MAPRSKVEEATLNLPRKRKKLDRPSLVRRRRGRWPPTRFRRTRTGEGGKTKAKGGRETEGRGEWRKRNTSGEKPPVGRAMHKHVLNLVQYGRVDVLRIVRHCFMHESIESPFSNMLCYIIIIFIWKYEDIKLINMIKLIWEFLAKRITNWLFVCFVEHFFL